MSDQGKMHSLTDQRRDSMFITMTSNNIFAILLASFLSVAHHVNADWDLDRKPTDDTKCQNYGSSSYIPNPMDCRTFFQCYNNRMIYKVCPRDHYFDESNRQCQHRSEPPIDCTVSVNAYSYNKPDMFPTTPAIDQTTTCARKPNGYTYKKPDGQCNTYTMCWSGVAHNGQCPNGFSYNNGANQTNPAKVCDISNNHRCSTSDATSLCPPTGIYAFRVLGNCSEYNFCFSGVHQVKYCPAGLHFDGRVQQCELKEKANCFECPVRDDPLHVVTFAIDAEPNAYLVCLNTEVVKFTCTKGLLWNQNAQQCEFNNLTYNPENSADTAIEDDSTPANNY